MGRISTPAHRIEYTVPADQAGLTNMAWPTKKEHGGGRPNLENLTRWVKHLEASFQPGGVNARCGEITILEARIVHQASGDVIAVYRAPVAAPAPLALAA